MLLHEHPFNNSAPDGNLSGYTRDACLTTYPGPGVASSTPARPHARIQEFSSGGGGGGGGRSVLQKKALTFFLVLSIFYRS